MWAFVSEWFDLRLVNAAQSPQVLLIIQLKASCVVMQKASLIKANVNLEASERLLSGDINNSICAHFPLPRSIDCHFASWDMKDAEMD